MALNYSFAGKKVLVTGGTGGIGRQIVQRLHTDGAHVFVLDIKSEEIQKLKQELPGVTAEVVDLLNWAETKKVIEGFGVLDHLVNNAALIRLQKFMDITQDNVNLLFGVNVGAHINVTQAVAKAMIDAKSPGTIVNLSSMAGVKHIPELTVYCASKAAVTMLTKSMAIELGEHGIRVNCLQPGPVDTPFARDAAGNVLGCAHDIIANATIKRLIDTKEIADLVLFLLSPLSSMITGEAVSIGSWNN